MPAVWLFKAKHCGMSRNKTRSNHLKPEHIVLEQNRTPFHKALELNEDSVTLTNSLLTFNNGLSEPQERNKICMSNTDAFIDKEQRVAFGFEFWIRL